MARTSTARSAEQITQDTGPAVDAAALEAAAKAHHAHAQVVAVVERDYAIDMPYNLQSYIHSIRQHAAESAIRLIEMGRMLIQIRERESREVFADALEQIGVGVRFAQRAMQTAIKLQDRPKLQSLGSSKVLELLSEDDETLDALQDGGTVAGLTLDELDAMSVRELKAALRTERKERAEEKAADEEIIRAKDDRINKLTRAKRAADPADEVREKANQLLQDADTAVVEAAAHLATLHRALQQIDQLYAEAGLATDADIQNRVDQNLEWAASQLAKLDL